MTAPQPSVLFEVQIDHVLYVNLSDGSAVVYARGAFGDLEPTSPREYSPFVWMVDDGVVWLAGSKDSRSRIWVAPAAYQHAYAAYLNEVMLK